MVYYIFWFKHLYSKNLLYNRKELYVIPTSLESDNHLILEKTSGTIFRGEWFS